MPNSNTETFKFLNIHQITYAIQKRENNIMRARFIEKERVRKQKEFDIENEKIEKELQTIKERIAILVRLNALSDNTFIFDNTINTDYDFEYKNEGLDRYGLGWENI